MAKFFQLKMIYLIFILGLILRLVALNQSLWLDEAIGALVVREQSFSQILSQFPKNDNHPPFYYLTLKAWTDIFGYSEMSLRAPSVIFGVATILMVYLIAKKFLKGKFFPYFSALLLATSPFHIYYSQEARMYMMAGFLASVSIYLYLRTFEKDIKLWVWIAFSLCIPALVFCDYVPVFLLPLFWLVGIVKKMNRAWWKKFLIAHTTLLVLGIVWLPTFLIQVNKGSWFLETLPIWREIAGGPTLKQVLLVWMKFVLGRISFADKLFYYTLIIIASIPYVISFMSALKRRKDIILVWLWLVLPLGLGFVVSFWFPVFIYFRFLYVIPAFYLLCAWGIAQYKFPTKIILTLSTLLINSIGWLFYIGEPYQQREQWRQAVSFIESRAGKSDLVVLENPEPFAPYRWYMSGKVPAFGATDAISPNQKKTEEKTKNTIINKNGLYYFEYLRDLMDPDRLVEKVIIDSGFVVDKVYDNFPGVGQITYWVKP